MTLSVKNTFATFMLMLFFAGNTYSSYAQNLSSTIRRTVNTSTEEITDNSIPKEIVKYDLEIAKNGLPDGRVATGTGDIAKAWYSEPTQRYKHGVLGDKIEAGALKVVNERGEIYTFRLPKTQVFEDITPRLADLDGDGKTEVITILSSVTQGASIAIFHLNGNAFIKAGQTPYIGLKNRWLNIAGIDRFTGNSNPEIAIVVRPHLDGLLQFYKFKSGKLELLASASGYTNHIIGSKELRLSTSLDVDQNRKQDLIIPSLNRRELVIIGVIRNRFDEVIRIPLPAKIDKAIATREVNGQTQLVVGLDDDKIYAISLQ